MPEAVLDVQALCAQIAQYSPCDVSDALLKLQVPSAGFLRDIKPIPSRHGSGNSLVAPVSTVLFVDKDHTPVMKYEGMIVPPKSNMSADKHFTDLALAGSVVLLQQPAHQVVALVGDIVATRYKLLGIKGCFIDGQVRDVVGIAALSKDASFQCWSKGLSSVGTSLQAKPWAMDVPIKVGDVVVNPGDLLVANEAEMVCYVIPALKIQEVVNLLAVHKEADDGLLEDVKSGMGFKEAIQRWPKHYSNH